GGRQARARVVVARREGSARLLPRAESREWWLQAAGGPECSHHGVRPLVACVVGSTAKRIEASRHRLPEPAVRVLSSARKATEAGRGHSLRDVAPRSYARLLSRVRKGSEWARCRFQGEDVPGRHGRASRATPERKDR